MTRDTTRAEAQRAKAAVRRWQRWRDIPLSPRTVGILAGARARCSGACCGNLRVYLGPTVQERREAQEEP